MNDWYQKIGFEVLDKYIEKARFEIQYKYKIIKHYPYSHFRYLYIDLFQNFLNEKTNFDKIYNYTARIQTFIEITTFIRHIEKNSGKIFIDEEYYKSDENDENN